jgi:hypothetical protein
MTAMSAIPRDPQWSVFGFGGSAADSRKPEETNPNQIRVIRG